MGGRYATVLTFFRPKGNISFSVVCRRLSNMGRAALGNEPRVHVEFIVVLSVKRAFDGMTFHSSCSRSSLSITLFLFVNQTLDFVSVGKLNLRLRFCSLHYD